MYKKFLKRFFDIICGFFGTLCFLLSFIFVAPLIYFTDKGPVFYNATRRGKNGKEFKMYKYRSMKVNSPVIKSADGSTYSGDDDPRLTKVGKLLRKTSVDELPQFINVLKGDMSIIGPRPTMASRKINLDELDENRKKRYSVKPGITGYSQAYFRNSITQEEKFANDAYYADNISFIFDVKIFFKTIMSVLGSKNINNSSQNANAEVGR